MNEDLWVPHGIKERCMASGPHGGPCLNNAVWSKGGFLVCDYHYRVFNGFSTEWEKKKVEAKDDYRIPSREEHNRQTRKLWINCIVVGCVIFVLVGGLMAYLFLTGHDTKKIVEVSTVTFQVLAVSYMACLFIPVLLVSLMRVTLGIEMSRKGLEIGNKTTSVLEKLDGSVEEKLERGDRIFDRIEKFLDTVEKGDHPLVNRLEHTFSLEMAALRREIKSKKDETDADLNAALDEGEREAENLTEEA